MNESVYKYIEQMDKIPVGVENTMRYSPVVLSGWLVDATADVWPVVKRTVDVAEKLDFCNSNSFTTNINLLKVPVII